MSWFSDAVQGYYRSKIASADAVESGIQSLGTSIGRAIEETRQNSIANQIGSQMANSGDYAPRAGLVSPGTNPDTGEENTIAPGTDTQGTAPAQFTGGYKGLQLQTAIDSLKRQNQNTQSEIGLRQAQAGYYGAHTDYLNKQSDINQQRANIYGQRANTYGNRENQISIAGFSKNATDLLGKDKAQTWINNITGGLPVRRGNLDENGNWQDDSTNGQMYSSGSSHDDLKKNAVPMNSVETLKHQYEQIGKQPQGASNLPQVTNAQDYAQVPSGAQYQDPQGNIRIKP